MAFTFTSAAVLTQTRVLVSFMTLLNISDKSQENSFKNPTNCLMVAKGRRHRKHRNLGIKEAHFLQYIKYKYTHDIDWVKNHEVNLYLSHYFLLDNKNLFTWGSEPETCGPAGGVGRLLCRGRGSRGGTGGAGALASSKSCFDSWEFGNKLQTGDRLVNNLIFTIDKTNTQCPQKNVTFLPRATWESDIFCGTLCRRNIMKSRNGLSCFLEAKNSIS